MLSDVRELKHQIEKKMNGYCRFIRSQQQGNQEYGSKFLSEQPVLYEVPNSRSPIPNPQETEE